MKKAFILLAILTVGMAAATAQDVKIKRGKVTMSEADYNVLKQKAELYEKTQQALNETLAAGILCHRQGHLPELAAAESRHQRTGRRPVHD